MTRKPPSWDEFENEKPERHEPGADILELEDICARLFSTADGKVFLAKVRKLKLERALPPSAPDSALRHLEGQRSFLLEIQTWTQRGFDRLAKSKEKQD